MKKQSVLWFLVAVIFIGIFLFFNSRGGQDILPLSDVFPQQADVQVPSVKYVYMDTKPIDSEGTSLQEISSQGEVAKSPVVEIENPGAIEEPIVKSDFESAAFTIQVASFKEKNYAQKALDKLKSQGYSGEVVTKDLNNKGIWHRVYVGAFQEKGEAQNYLAKIRDFYPDSLIITLK